MLASRKKRLGPKLSASKTSELIKSVHRLLFIVRPPYNSTYPSIILLKYDYFKKRVRENKNFLKHVLSFVELNIWDLL